MARAVGWDLALRWIAGSSGILGGIPWLAWLPAPALAWLPPCVSFLAWLLNTTYPGEALPKKKHEKATKPREEQEVKPAEGAVAPRCPSARPGPVSRRRSCRSRSRPGETIEPKGRDPQTQGREEPKGRDVGPKGRAQGLYTAHHNPPRAALNGLLWL